MAVWRVLGSQAVDKSIQQTGIEAARLLKAGILKALSRIWLDTFYSQTVTLPVLAVE
jgi:hypothetical protein